MDLRRLQRTLQPRTIGYLYAANLSIIPLNEFLSSGCSVWLVDGRAQRPAPTVGRISKRNQFTSSASLSCDAVTPGGEPRCSSFVAAADPEMRACTNCVLVGDVPICKNFDPVASPRIICADSGLGRGPCFATRIEEVVATARTPAAAVETALDGARRCARMESTLDIESHSLDLVISVLAPSKLRDEPYRDFDEHMCRRFGASWRDAASNDLLGELRSLLFRMQVEGHICELTRLVEPTNGHVYFAMHSLVENAGGGWAMAPATPGILELLNRYFLYDFDHFGTEATLRWESRDPPRLVQTALLKPRDAADRSSQQPPPRRSVLRTKTPRREEP